MAELLAIPTPGRPSPNPRPVALPGLTMFWEGWDSTLWELSGTRSSNGVRLLAGTRGFHFPPKTPFKSVAANAPGSRPRGHRVTDREVMWNLAVYEGGRSQAWLDFDAAWWKTLEYGRTGTWVVTQPNGTSRRLQLSMVDDGFPSVDVDPSLMGWAHYGVTLEATQPFWEGAPIVGGPWSGGSDPGDFPWHIGSGSTLGSAVMSNPGDVDAYPVWTVEGPTTSVTVGVGSRLITFPSDLAEGESVVIDPRPGPRGKSVYDNTGARRTSELTVRDFAPIPAGGSSELSLSMVGAGSVSAVLKPLHFRAW